jgi:hypothetical protein
MVSEEQFESETGSGWDCPPIGKPISLSRFGGTLSQDVYKSKTQNGRQPIPENLP